MVWLFHRETLASPGSGQPLAGNILPLRPILTVISSCNTAHMRVHFAEGKAASRYTSSVCVYVCVHAHPRLCVSVTQRESSSHLCLSAAPASLTNEARNDSSALHSASLSLPHNTRPTLHYYHHHHQPPNKYTPSTLLPLLLPLCSGWLKLNTIPGPKWFRIHRCHHLHCQNHARQLKPQLENKTTLQGV